MKNRFIPVMLGIMVFLLMAVPVLATVAYKGVITVTSNTTYTELPVTSSVNVNSLISSGYVNANATDLTLDDGTYYIPFMPVDDRINFVPTSIPSGQSIYNLKTANATLATEFPIIPGYGGNITVSDAVELEANDTFSFTISGYFDTETPNVDKNVIYKQDALRLSVPSTGNLKLEVLGASPTEVTFACPSGYHEIQVTCDGVTIGIGFADNTLNDDAGVYTPTTTTAGASTVARRNILYAAGYYYVFYVSGNSEISYRSSADGITWSSATVVSSDSKNNYSFSIWFDGTYFHYSAGGYSTVNYRMGTPSSGNITWASAEVTAASSAVSNSGTITSIACDTDGYPWITYATTVVGTKNYYAIKSSTKNGTWTTDAAYTKSLGSGSYTPQLNLVQLPGTEMLATWSVSGSIKAYKWQTGGLGWGTSETIVSDEYVSSGTGKGYGVTAGPGGITYFTYLQATTYNLRALHRHADGSLSAAVTVQAGDATMSPPALGYLQDMTRMYVFWNNYPVANKIYYAEYDIATDTWGSPIITWQSESFTTYQYIACAYKSVSGKLPVAWSIDKATDEVRVSWLQVDSPSEEVALVAAVPDNDNDWFFLDGSVSPYTDEFSYSVEETEVLNFHPARLIESSTLPDTAGTAQDGTFNWGTNPAGLTAVLTSFQPIAQATPTAIPTATSVINPTTITGNFSTTVNGTDPWSAIIKTLAEASDTPAQLPVFILVGFITLALSLGVSYVIKKHGGTVLAVKIIVISFCMLIGWFIHIVDLWMMLVFWLFAGTTALLARR